MVKLSIIFTEIQISIRDKSGEKNMTTEWEGERNKKEKRRIIRRRDNRRRREPPLRRLAAQYQYSMQEMSTTFSIGDHILHVFLLTHLGNWSNTGLRSLSIRGQLGLLDSTDKKRLSNFPRCAMLIFILLLRKPDIQIHQSQLRPNVFDANFCIFAQRNQLWISYIQGNFKILDLVTHRGRVCKNKKIQTLSQMLTFQTVSVLAKYVKKYCRHLCFQFFSDIYNYCSSADSLCFFGKRSYVACQAFIYWSTSSSCDDVITNTITTKTLTSARWKLGKPSFQKSAVFLNIVQKAFDPPSPFYLNICPILQGVFFKRVFEH